MLQNKQDAAVAAYQKQAASKTNDRKQLFRLVQGGANIATFALADNSLRVLGADPTKYFGELSAIIVLGVSKHMPSSMPCMPSKAMQASYVCTNHMLTYIACTCTHTQHARGIIAFEGICMGVTYTYTYTHPNMQYEFNGLAPSSVAASLLVVRPCYGIY